MSRLAKAAIGLEIFLSVGAIGGGIALMAGPKGQILPLPLAALAGSPFADYFVPGVILFAILGLGPLVAVVPAWRQHPSAPFWAIAVGVALLIWMLVEIEIVGFASRPPLQPFYLALGAAITVVGLAWSRPLPRIRLIHTAVWAVFAAAIVTIPVVTYLGRLRLGLWLSVLVFAEVALLLLNCLRCPLTSIAARYTADRSANFDIYLPAWLAANNKLIFGSLFAAAEALLLWRFSVVR